MSKQIRIFLVFLVFFSITGRGTSDFVNPTKYELLKYLLDPNRYDPSLFPGYFTGNQSEVVVQLSVTDIDEISDPAMEFQMIVYLRMQWEDTRLIYKDNATYDVLEIAGDKVNQVWTPDIYFLDERRSSIHQINSVEKLVYIHPYGKVTYSERLSVTSECNMDLRKFPFDSQNCTIILQSYAFTSDALVLRWSEVYPFQLTSDKIPQFAASFDNNDVTGGTYTFEHSIVGGNFSFLQTSILFKRISTSYISMYIAPYPIFMGLATASFGLKEIIPKMTACSGALSTTILQWIAIYSKLPAVAYLSDLDEWILLHVIFIGSIFIYHIVHFWLKNLYCEKPESKDNTKQDKPESKENTRQDKPESKENTRQDKPESKDNAEGDTTESIDGSTRNNSSTNIQIAEINENAKQDESNNFSKTHIAEINENAKQDKGIGDCIVVLAKGLIYDKTGTTFCLDLLAGCVVFAVYSIYSSYYITEWGLGDKKCFGAFSLLIVLVVGLHLLAYYRSLSRKTK